MTNVQKRWLYAALITGSIIFTPIVGIWGPFANGAGVGPGAREYFLPAGYVFATVWSVNYLALAIFGIWQALPAQRDNARIAHALPWVAITAAGNALWIAFAGAQNTIPLTVVALIIMQVSMWVAYFRLGIDRGQFDSRVERWLQLGMRIYTGWLSVATIANSAAALIALEWDGFGIAPTTWAVVMLVVGTVVAGVVGRLANNDNVYRGVFVYAFVGIVVAQSDVPAIVWTAIVCATIIIAMIIGTTLTGQQTRAVPSV